MNGIEAFGLGELFARLRSRAGFTQEELAEKADLSVRGLRNIELGHVALESSGGAAGPFDGGHHFVPTATHPSACRAEIRSWGRRRRCRDFRRVRRRG